MVEPLACVQVLPLLYYYFQEGRSISSWYNPQRQLSQYLHVFPGGRQGASADVTVLHYSRESSSSYQTEVQWVR
jgi:hypothetical protein